MTNYLKKGCLLKNTGNTLLGMTYGLQTVDHDHAQTMFSRTGNHPESTLRGKFAQLDSGPLAEKHRPVSLPDNFYIGLQTMALLIHRQLTPPTFYIAPGSPRYSSDVVPAIYISSHRMNVLPVAYSSSNRAHICSSCRLFLINLIAE